MLSCFYSFIFDLNKIKAAGVSFNIFTVVQQAQEHFLYAELRSPTPCRFLTNAYLREEAPNSHVVEQRVEWQVQRLLSIFQEI